MPVVSIQKYRSTSRVLALLCSTALTGAVLSVASPMPAKAQQVWLGNAAGDEQNFLNPDNWSTANPPDTTAETAVFQDTGSTDVSISSATLTWLGGIRYAAGAQAYTTTIDMATSSAGFVLGGDGIVNNSGLTQIINISGRSPTYLVLRNDASLGDNVVVNNSGVLQFDQSSSGGTAQVNSIGGTILLVGTTDTVTLGSVAGTGAISFDEGAGQVLEIGALGLDTEYSGWITQRGAGSGSLSKVGTGTMTLSGNNGYSGGTRISAGTLLASSSNALGTGPVTLGGGVLALTGTPTLDNDIDLTAAGTIRFDAGTTGTLNGDISTNGQMLTLNTLGTGAINGDIDGSTSTIMKTGPGALTINGVVSGTGAGIMAGSGTLVLNGANTYGGGSGSTLIGNGTLVVGNDHALSTSRLSSNSAGSVLSVNKDISLANNVSLFGGFGLTIDTAGHALDMSGAFQTIGDPAPIIKTGAGTLTLSGANSGFPGATTVSEGTLAVTGQLGSNGGTIGYMGADPDATASARVSGPGASWVTSGSFTVGASGKGALIVEDGGHIVSSGDNHIGAGGGIVTVTGSGSKWTNDRIMVGHDGIGELNISHGGEVTTSASSFIGGWVDLNNGPGAATVSGDGSIWNVGAYLNVGYNDAGALTIASGGEVNQTNAFVGAGLANQGTVSVTGTGSKWISRGSLIVGHLGVGEVTVDAGGYVDSGEGVIGSYSDPRVRGAVTVTGQESRWVNSGELYVGNGNGTLTIADGGAVSAGGITLAQGIDASGTLNIGAAAGNATVAAGALITPSIEFGDGAGTLVFNHTDTDYVFSTGLQSTGTGAHAIEHMAGDTVLTGDSSDFSGNTIVHGGALAVNGTLGGTATVGNGGMLIVGDDSHSTASLAGDVTVNTGGTLGGIGTISGDVDVNGTLSAGNSPGTLTVTGDLTLGSGSTSVFELNTPGVVGGTGAVGNDLVKVGGNLALGGALDARVAAAGYYRLFDYNGSLTDTFDSGTLTGTGGFAPLSSNNPDIRYDTPKQVNLSVLAAGQTMQFWDGIDATSNGTVDGGTGTWSGFGTNWTDSSGSTNGSWAGSVGVFAGSAGTVMVDGRQSFDTLQFSTDGYTLTGGTLALTPASGMAGTLNIDNGVSTTVASIISDGTGNSLKKTGGGTLVLEGTNTYTSGTQLLGGALSVSSDANLGNASGDLTFDGGTLITKADIITVRDVALGAGGGTFQTDERLELTGTISGDGGLAKTGTGALVLGNANSYAGGTTISDGYVNATATDALGSGPVDVTGGELRFSGNASAEDLAITLAAASMSFADTASAGTATIVNKQSGINFYNTASAEGASIINKGGGISFNDSSSAGNVVITIDEEGTGDFYGAATAGTATITGHYGAVRFHGANTADGATIINHTKSHVDISDLSSNGITIGSLSGDGAIHLGSKTLTLGGLGRNDAIGGVIEDGTGGSGGSLTKTGAGTLTLTGVNTYTGGTSVDAGTLQIGDGGTAGSILGGVDIASAGTFAFNRGDDLAFAEALSGAGQFMQMGTGALLYDGNGSGFAGTTIIADGSLIVGSGIAHVDAVLGGSFDVQDGATLGGIGTVGSGAGSAVTIALGGTIAPGNSIGTLTVDGDLNFAAGSTYEAEINPALESDLISASGAATINGGTVHAVKAGGVYTPGSRWTIIGADDGVTGTFDDLTQNMPFVDLALAYDVNKVYIDTARNQVAFCDVAKTRNQCATGEGVESTGAGNPVYDAVAAIPDETSARQALDALSGEIHASAKAALIEDSRFVRDAANNRIRAAFGDAAAPSMPVMAYGPGGTEMAPASTERFAAWGQAFGSWGSFDGDGTAAGLDHDTGGLLMGMDGFVTEAWRLGLLAGYSHSSFDARGRASSGSSDNYHLGLYAGTQWGNLGFRTGAAYTWHDIETSRSVVFPGFTDRLSGDYDAGTFQAFGELGYKIDTAAASFEPFANLTYVKLSTDAFTETGGTAAVAGRSSSTDATFTTLGIRASTSFDLGGMKATARGMVGWRHAFGDVTPLSTHAFAGADAFAVAGVPIARDAALLEAGVDLNLTDAATFGLSYTGQLSGSARDHGFKADLSVRF